MSDPTGLDIVFLGLAERAATVTNSFEPLRKLNFVGLRSIAVVPFLPWQLVKDSFVFAVRGKFVETVHVSLRDADDVEIIRFTFSPEHRPGDIVPEYREENKFPALPGMWHLTCISAQDPTLNFTRAGYYSLVALSEDVAPKLVGSIQIVQADYMPFSDEQIAAIKAHPRAAKAARVTLGCKRCSERMKVYCGLERHPQSEHEGYLWYLDIPDVFVCKCGVTKTDLTSLRRNFFMVLGGLISANPKDISYIPEYEVSVIEQCRYDFIELLNKNPPEEDLQKFIEKNNIILHQFPADRIFFKPSILNLFKADFAILTPEKTLILIEIEKADTRLLKKDGGRAADLNHAFDQVDSWLATIRDHLGAVLDSIDIKRDKVARVSGVVIAGRDGNYNIEHLRRLKGSTSRDISMLTFDDLAGGLTALSHQLRRL